MAGVFEENIGAGIVPGGIHAVGKQMRRVRPADSTRVEPWTGHAACGGGVVAFLSTREFQWQASRWMIPRNEARPMSGGCGGAVALRT